MKCPKFICNPKFASLFRRFLMYQFCPQNVRIDRFFLSKTKFQKIQEMIAIFFFRIVRIDTWNFTWVHINIHISANAASKWRSCGNNNKTRNQWIKLQFVVLLLLFVCLMNQMIIMSYGSSIYRLLINWYLSVLTSPTHKGFNTFLCQRSKVTSITTGQQIKWNCK